MRPDRLPVITVFTAIVIAALVNILPLRLFHAGGDMQFHLVLIDCFAGQFWQGDIYPRWCFAANGGLGVPVFMFYFPLPYYAASLFYPLVWVGASLDTVYTASLFAATLLTAWTLYLWLRDIAPPPRALLVSLLVLFMPYRMEAMLFRAGYAEIWGMAFMPLLFMAARRIMLEKKAAVPLLAAAVGLLLVTHVPLAICGFIACSLYILIMAPKPYMRTLIRCKTAGLWGVFMALLYLFPGLYFRRFMQPPDVAGETPWANGFMTWQNLHEQGRVVVGDLLSVIVLVVLASVILWQARRRIEDDYQRRELRAWLCMSLIASVLLCPVSAPLYDVLRPWSGIVFPWRMQGIFVFALAFLLALWMRWFVSDRRLRTWKGDYAMLFALMVLLSFFMLGIRPDDAQRDANIMGTHLVAEPEYQTLWQDSKHFNDEYFFARLKKKPSPLELVSGKGKLEVTHWDWHGISFTSDLPKPASVRVDHTYFPVWAAEMEDGTSLELTPEKGTGRMLVALPAGKHTVGISHGLWNHMPIILIIISVLSLKAAGGCLWGLMRHPIARLALTKQGERASFRA